MKITKPSNISLIGDTSILRTTDTTYNDSSITYSLATQIYAGKDRMSYGKPKNTIETIKPNNE